MGEARKLNVLLCDRDTRARLPIADTLLPNVQILIGLF